MCLIDDIIGLVFDQVYRIYWQTCKHLPIDIRIPFVEKPNSVILLGVFEQKIWRKTYYEFREIVIQTDQAMELCHINKHQSSYFAHKNWYCILTGWNLINFLNASLLNRENEAHGINRTLQYSRRWMNFENAYRFLCILSGNLVFLVCLFSFVLCHTVSICGLLESLYIYF